MLSYLTDDFYNWTRKICRNALLKVLAAGPVPHHIAFVMDGNRRYARMNHKLAQQGHTDGYETLTKVHQNFLFAKGMNDSKILEIRC